MQITSDIELSGAGCTTAITPNQLVQSSSENDTCPLWPGKPVSAHWGVPDPAAVEGTEEQQRKAFLDAAITLRRRIELFLSLPLQRLDAMSLQRELRDIGRQ